MKKIFFLLIILAFLMPILSYAGDGETMPWDGPLEKVMGALTGKTVMIIGIILIAGAGIMLATSDGGAAKQKIFFIILGIGIALNAPRVLEMLFGQSVGLLW